MWDHLGILWKGLGKMEFGQNLFITALCQNFVTGFGRILDLNFHVFLLFFVCRMRVTTETQIVLLKQIWMPHCMKSWAFLNYWVMIAFPISCLKRKFKLQCCKLKADGVSKSKCFVLLIGIGKYIYLRNVSYRT